MSATPSSEVAARDIIASTSDIVVLTGAGISTRSGIPDFRGPDGVWTRNPDAERLSTIDIYLTDDDVRRRAWVTRRNNPAWTAEPNAAHRALANAQREGRVRLLVTQNVDGLHQLAGHDPDRVVEVHGTMRSVICTGCSATMPTETVFERVEAGDADPHCAECGAILKTATVYFGEALDPERLDAAFEAAADADVLVTIGTSLAVSPINAMVSIAHRAGTSVIIVNGEPTEMDALADVVVRGDIAEVVPVLFATDGAADAD